MMDEQAQRKANKKIPFRVNVSGFTGEPVSLVAMFDPDTDILAVAQAMAYEDGPRDGFLCVTTQARDQHHDAVFVRDEFQEAIRAYLEMDAMSLVKMHEKVARFSPSHVIERDGMNEHGDKYRIQAEASNGHVAVLVAALFAKRQGGAVAAEEMMSDLMGIMV